MPLLASMLGSFLNVERVMAGLGTIASTFVGAWLAFKFAKRTRDIERKEADVSSGNRALFTLSRMWNRVKQHQLEITDVFREREDSWLKYIPDIMLVDDLSFDMKELSFIMQHNAGVYQSLFLEEDRCRSVANLIARHQNLMVTEVWPKLQAANVQHGETRTVAEFEAILGPATVQILKGLTSGIISSIDANVNSFEKTFDELRVALKKLYPDRKFLTAKFAVRPDYKPQLKIPDRKQLSKK